MTDPMTDSKEQRGEEPVDGFSERFAKMMKRRREAEGHTPSTLATMLGVSEEYIRAIERGERSPNSNLLVRIVLALKLDANRLVYGSKASRAIQRVFAGQAAA